MAVPPADDGSVDAPVRRFAGRGLFFAATTVVIVACLGILTYLYLDRTDSSASAGDRIGSLISGSDDDSAAEDEANVREKVIAQAEQFVLRINTYGPGDLDKNNAMPGFADRVHEVISPKFAADFDTKGLTLAEQSVAQTGYARSVKVVAIGVESQDVDSAVVLAAGQISGTYPDPQRPKKRLVQEPVQFRFSVNLVKSGGDWLVDDFTPVTGDPEDATTPAPSTQAPTDQPTDQPTKSRGQR